MASIIDFAFYPSRFSKPRFANGTALCPVPGEKVDGRIVDTNCDADKFEACLIKNTCFDGRCSSKTQLQVANFLFCFEGGHSSNMSFAEKCTSTSGLNYHSAMSCYKNSKEKEAAWGLMLSKAPADMAAFPWVLLNGKALSESQTAGFGKQGIGLLCAAYTGRKPTFCPDRPTPPPPPADPCKGHRCDTGACPCGCECGNDKDPGLCYVPAEISRNVTSC